MGAYSTLTSLLGYQHEAEQDRDQPIRNARQAPVQHVVPVAVDPIAQRLLDVDHLDHIAASERAPRHRVELRVELVAVARRRRLVPADPREVGGGLVEAR